LGGAAFSPQLNFAPDQARANGRSCYGKRAPRWGRSHLTAADAIAGLWVATAQPDLGVGARAVRSPHRAGSALQTTRDSGPSGRARLRCGGRVPQSRAGVRPPGNCSKSGGMKRVLIVDDEENIRPLPSSDSGARRLRGERLYHGRRKPKPFTQRPGRVSDRRAPARRQRIDLVRWLRANDVAAPAL